MRVRTILLVILIVVVVGGSVATLALPEIHIAIPGVVRLDRADTGPLGLKLGLDLQGGAHLVYQAESNTTLTVAFEEDAETSPEAISTTLDDLDYEARVNPTGEEQTFRISGDYLTAERREEVRLALVEAIGEPTEFVNDDVEPPTSDQMDGVLSIISRRVNLYGTEEPIVQRFGDDRIIVQLPGASGSVVTVAFANPSPAEEEDGEAAAEGDGEAAAEDGEGEDGEAAQDGAEEGDGEAAAEEETAEITVGNIAQLVREQGYSGVSVTDSGGNIFRIRTNDTVGLEDQRTLRSALDDEFGMTRFLFATSGIDDAKRLIGATARLEFMRTECGAPVIDFGCQPPFEPRSIGLTGADLNDADVSRDHLGQWVVNVQFNNRGTEIFSDMTRDINVVTNPQSNEVIGVFLDGVELISPVSRAHIRDGRSQISGGFDREEARLLAAQLKSGSLPVPMELIQESEVASLLGAESLERSLMAGLVGLGLVLVFVIAYYRAAGLVAAVALVCYAMITLAIFKLVPVTLTLPHIGGFILSIGLAVDANILIFERLKEEIRLGRSLASAMDVGFRRAWPAIRDGNISTLITCAVLLWFGNRLGGGLINGFALTLAIGVMVSMFSAVLVSRNLLQALHAMGLSRATTLFTPEKVRPRQGVAGRR